MVPATGLEPVRCYSLEPESSASANSATRAYLKGSSLFCTVSGADRHFRRLITPYWPLEQAKMPGLKF